MKAIFTIVVLVALTSPALAARSQASLPKPNQEAPAPQKAECTLRTGGSFNKNAPILPEGSEAKTKEAARTKTVI